MMRIPAVILCFFLAPLSGGTQLCKEEPDFYRYFPVTIGSGDVDTPTLHLIQCDTVYIRKDITVKVLPNTFIAWADPRPGNAIIVYGSLIVQGAKARAAVFSNSIDTVLFSPDAMKSPWRGITIESSGSAVLQNASIFGAKIPVTTRSSDVSISNSFFFDAERIDLTKGNIIWLNKKKFIEDLNIAAYLEKQEKKLRAEQAREAAADSSAAVNPDKRHRKWRALWYIAPTLAIGGGATAWFLLRSENNGPSETAGFLEQLEAIWPPSEQGN